MAWHDIAMTRLSQWWKRVRRGGFAYAEGAALHGRGPERYRMGELRRILFWGGVLPVVALLGALFISPWMVLLLSGWLVQILRMWRRGMSLEQAAFLTFGKLPEMQGVLDFWSARLRGKRQAIMEYK